MQIRIKIPIIAPKGGHMKYRKWDSKTKSKIVLEGLENNITIAELCNKELQSKAHKVFETKKQTKKERNLKEENKKLKQIIAELSIELKKTELELNEGDDL